MCAIAIGAVPGALSRYYITELSHRFWGNKFPIGTFIINISGCLIMGFLVTLISGMKGFPTEARLMMTTGFLGAYTTFSTYGFDTLRLWRGGNIKATIFYWGGSAILGVIALEMGMILAQFISQ
jgi:CrcB protein